MSKNYKIVRQASQLSEALAEKGIANKLETPKACKYAVIAIPRCQLRRRRMLLLLSG